MTVYRNAVAIGSVTLAKPAVGSLLDGAIGAIGKTARLHGNVDEVAVYNRALTPSTLLSHYQLAGYCAGRGAMMVGSTGADRLTGTPNPEVIVVRAGNDRISAGGGNDLICGGPGNDRIFSRDSRRDVIDCGPGHDVAIVDRIDRTRRCETVIRAHAPRRPQRSAPRGGLG